jgi:N-acylneuraminate cytidylyltransferase
MKVLAVIPARGGSKGIPYKNVKLVMGRPLISYMIMAAESSKYITDLFVSTDDREIGEIAIGFGAKVYWRPPEISGDRAKSEDAVLNALSQHPEVPDLTVMLQCTSPLTIGEDIDGTIKTLLDNNADTSLAVTPFHYFLWNQNGEGINHDKTVRLSRQEREDQFLETGAVYVMRTQGFLERKHRFFGKTSLYIMPKERVLEIDEPVDLTIAKAIMRP